MRKEIQARENSTDGSDSQKIISNPSLRCLFISILLKFQEHKTLPNVISTITHVSKNACTL